MMKTTTNHYPWNNCKYEFMVLACAFWSFQGNNSMNVFDHKTFLLLISCKVWSQMSCMWLIGMNAFDIIYSFDGIYPQ